MALQPTVLIADDQTRARQALRALLVTCGPVSVIVEAREGTEAVRLAQECRPNVVLLDVRMPGLNGIEATRLIRAACPETRIIVLSIYSEYRGEALLAGADAFLNKADVPQQLLPLITSLMGM